MPKCVGGRGSAPDPAGRAHDAPPDALVGWGGGYPLPNPTTLGAYGASILAPSALATSVLPPPQTFGQIYAYDCSVCKHGFSEKGDIDKAYIGLQSGPEKNCTKFSAPSFCTVSSRIGQFSPKCSEKITAYQNTSHCKTFTSLSNIL